MRNRKSVVQILARQSILTSTKQSPLASHYPTPHRSRNLSTSVEPITSTNSTENKRLLEERVSKTERSLKEDRIKIDDLAKNTWNRYPHCGFFETKLPPVEEFIEAIVTRNSSSAIIPNEYLNKLVDASLETSIIQGNKRVFDLLALGFAGCLEINLPLLGGIGLLSIGYRNFKIADAKMTLSDLVTKQKFLDNDKADLVLKGWMKKNDITCLSINMRDEIVLHRKKHEHDNLVIDTVIEWQNESIDLSKQTEEIKQVGRQL